MYIYIHVYLALHTHWDATRISTHIGCPTAIAANAMASPMSVEPVTAEGDAIETAAIGVAPPATSAYVASEDAHGNAAMKLQVSFAEYCLFL